MALLARHSRGKATRAAILEAAEDLFAQHGLEGTRLLEVAERVGIQRPAIAYYFRDKRELYDAVLERLMGDVFSRVRSELLSAAPLAERIENAVSVWVDYVGSRPSFARIVLREIAAGAGGRVPHVVRYIRPFIDLGNGLVEATDPDKRGGDPSIDAIHLASTIAGATLFFVAAIPMLTPGVEFDPLDAGELAAHKEEMRRVTRRLLAMRAPQLFRAAEPTR